MASIPDDPVVPPPVTGDRPLTRVMNMAGAYGLRNHTVRSIRDLKGVRQLVETLPFLPEEAAAAEAAGIDTMKVRCSRGRRNFLSDSPGDRGNWIGDTRRLAFDIRQAAPHTFMSFVLPLTEITSEAGALRAAFDAMEAGADAIMGQFGLPFVEALAKAGVPVQGHVGLVPRKSTWTGGLRAVGKTVDEAVKIYRDLKDLENAGAWAAECEVVPAPLMRELSARTTLVTASIGSGAGGDIQFLFAQDVLGDGEPPFPRHAKRYCDLREMRRKMREEWFSNSVYRGDYVSDLGLKVLREINPDYDRNGAWHSEEEMLREIMNQKIEEMRIPAFREFVADVRSGAFPGPEHVVDVGRDVVDGFLEAIGG